MEKFQSVPARFAASSLQGAADETGATPQMKGSLNEIDALLDGARAEVTRTVTQGQQAQRLAQRTRGQIEELYQAAGLAVSAGREEDAKAALARQFDLEWKLDELEEIVRTSRLRTEAIEQVIADLTARRNVIEQGTRRSFERPAARTFGKAGAKSRAQGETPAEAFHRMMQAVNTHELDRQPLAPLDTASRQEAIASRLAALKAPRTTLPS